MSVIRLPVPQTEVVADAYVVVDRESGAVLPFAGSYDDACTYALYWCRRQRDPDRYVVLPVRIIHE